MPELEKVIESLSKLGKNRADVFVTAKDDVYSSRGSKTLYFKVLELVVDFGGHDLRRLPLGTVLDAGLAEKSTSYAGIRFPDLMVERKVHLNESRELEVMSQVFDYLAAFDPRIHSNDLQKAPRIYIGNIGEKRFHPIKFRKAYRALQAVKDEREAQRLLLHDNLGISLNDYDCS